MLIDYAEPSGGGPAAPSSDPAGPTNVVHAFKERDEERAKAEAKAAKKKAKGTAGGEPAAAKKKSARKKAAKAKESPQGELPGMPKLDGVGKAARRMKDAIEAHDAATEEKGAASDALIKSLKKARRTSIQIEGYKFQYKHNGPSDKILVQKPK